LGQETALETTLKRNFMPLSLCQGLMFGPNDHADMKLIQKAICCRMRKKKKPDPGLEKPFSSRDSDRLTTTKIRNVFYLYQSFPEKLTKRYD
jgi:hypothetical protein